MNDERRRFWTERIAREVGPDETVRALLLARQPGRVTAGEAAEAAIALAAATDPGPTTDVGEPAQHVIVAATDRRVVAWRINGEEVIGRVADWPHERARLRLQRGLFGSRIRAGHQQVWMLSPFGGRTEAKALLAAAGK